jgi:putative sigma-54 modulation protein
MTTTIQSVHFDADKKLVDFIQEKVEKLKNLYDGIIIGSHVILRLDKASDNTNKIAEIILKLNGSEVFAKKQCATFEESIDASIDALKSQLKKYKEKKALAKY